MIYLNRFSDAGLFGDDDDDDVSEYLTWTWRIQKSFHHPVKQDTVLLQGLKKLFM
jgi:hypothetical protein